MTMDRELIDKYLEQSENAFDRILADGERKRHRRVWTITASACAAAAALLLWLVPARKAPESPITPVQIAEGIQQMMLLDIGEIESIVATPQDSHAILTAHLKDGRTCSYILKFNDADGTTTLLSYINKN